MMLIAHMEERRELLNGQQGRDKQENCPHPLPLEAVKRED